MNKKILIGIVISVLLLGVIGLSYSFFSVSVTGEGRQNTVTAGTLELEYIDGNGVSFPRAYPGQSATKVISVKNTGTLDTEYDLLYKDLINEIENDELVVSYTCTSYKDYVSSTNKGTVSGTCNGISNQVVPYTTTMADRTITSKISIASSIAHEYTFTFTFKEMNAAQNYNQGKHFSTKINISESSDEQTAQGSWYESCSASSNNLNCKIITAQTPSSDANINFAYTSEGNLLDEEVNVLVDSTQITNGLYYTSRIDVTEDLDNNGEGERVYYYRGAVENNNVVFGEFENDEKYYKGYQSSTSTNSKSYPTLEACQSASSYNYNCEKVTVAKRGKEMCWRIVRTNEDGSVRLRYNGTYENGTCPVTGTDVKINDTAYVFYGRYNNEKYNEYIWEDGTGESFAKTTIDAWYTSSGLINYDILIANVPYCADKSNPTEITFEDEDTAYTFYGAANRLIDITTFLAKSDAQPTYKCARVEDKHTVSGDTWGGNGKLSKPIALLTADEVAFAGGSIFDNTSYYLYTSSDYWTMSPSIWGFGYAYLFNLTSAAYFGDLDVNTSVGLLPSVSLKAEITVDAQGDGTYTNPYVVDTPLPPV